MSKKLKKIVQEIQTKLDELKVAIQEAEQSQPDPPGTPPEK